jgi:hypothetical protein
VSETHGNKVKRQNNPKGVECVIIAIINISLQPDGWLSNSVPFSFNPFRVDTLSFSAIP